MENAKWQISIEEMDVRWEVFMWPTKMSNEINKQEKNMRALEFQFKRNMEEEQVEFNQDRANLQSDVAKLKDLTKLQEAAKNAETVRRLRTSLTQAEEKARVFNSREALFNTTMTEYTELSEVTKIFEPFFDLWDCAEKWLSNKESWTDGPFLNLDPENVEKCIRNLRNIELTGLNTYLKRTIEEEKLHQGMFREYDSCLQRILDDCFIDLGSSLQWSKQPTYACNCDVSRVWRALRLLPKTDIIELIETQNTIEVSL
jgi:hypothetical protein